MDPEAIERLFIDMLSEYEPEIVADLASRGLEDTPNNRIIVWKEMEEFMVREFGTTSALSYMIKALISWHIDQLLMQIHIMS